jgi:hypothetical protein
MSFAAEPGPSHSIRVPKGGPYDERLSYVGLPMFLASLSAQRFTVQRQADWSAALDRFVDDSVTCEEARQEVYGWLYKANSTHKQDLRIRILLKQDAFNRILQDWQRQGYPFGHLVPALGTAIGSSGDRPDASPI